MSCSAVCLALGIMGIAVFKAIHPIGQNYVSGIES